MRLRDIILSIIVAAISLIVIVMIFAFFTQDTVEEEKARCDADSTDVADVGKFGALIEGATCSDQRVKNAQKVLCSEALKEARKNCDDACALFFKLNEQEEATTQVCERDKGNSKTHANPSLQRTSGA